MVVLVVVPFLNEERYLGRLLDSMAEQTRPPDRLVLVNDGSTDGSDAIAGEFAASHDYATLLRRPPRSRGHDRLAAAGPLLAFQWAVEQSGGGWDVLAKLDADVQLTPDTIEAIEQRLESDPGLGMAGAYLSEAGPDGVPVRMRSRPEHVHGATTFYRRECYEDIAPLPAIVGWDMIDANRARMRGWGPRAFPFRAATRCTCDPWAPRTACCAASGGGGWPPMRWASIRFTSSHTGCSAWGSGRS